MLLYAVKNLKDGYMCSIHTSKSDAIANAKGRLSVGLDQPWYGHRGRDAVVFVPNAVVDEYDTSVTDDVMHNAVKYKRVWPTAPDLKIRWLGTELAEDQRRGDRWPDELAHDIVEMI